MCNDIIGIIEEAKNKEDLNGSFYKNGWNDACDYILNKLDTNISHSGSDDNS